MDVKADYNDHIFHQKFILRDYGLRWKSLPTAAVLTGSTNFTVTGVSRNLTHVIALHDPRICQAYLLEWQDDFRVEVSKGTRGLHHIELIVEYVMAVNEEVTVRNLSEALKPMGTDAEEILNSSGPRLLEKGRQEGRRENQLEVARKALAKGMAPADVAELTDLPLDEVEKLVH